MYHTCIRFIQGSRLPRGKSLRSIFVYPFSYCPNLLENHKVYLESNIIHQYKTVTVLGVFITLVTQGKFGIKTVLHNSVFLPKSSPFTPH